MLSKLSNIPPCESQACVPIDGIYPGDACGWILGEVELTFEGN